MTALWVAIAVLIFVAGCGWTCAYQVATHRDTRAIQCQHVMADDMNGDHIAERAIGLLAPGEDAPGEAYCWGCRTWLTYEPYGFHASEDRRIILKTHADGDKT